MPLFSYPAFLLYEDGWNDYGVCSQFLLRCVLSSDSSVDIGNVKIIVEKQGPGTIDYPERTADYIPSTFTSLDETGGGCSLGQEKAYYLNLLQLFKGPDATLEFLYALSDCALFHECYKSMSDHACFHSLVRYDTAEQMLRTARLVLYKSAPENLYHLRYTFYSPYNVEEPMGVQFEFKEESSVIPRRIYAVIGENGTGKTSLLNQLTLDYLSKKKEVFANQIPPYSKIIRVSTSIYDDYTDPVENETCEFAFCGIRHHELNDQSMTQVLNKRIKEAIKKLKKEKRSEDGERKLYKLLRVFLSDEILSEVCDGGYYFYENMDYTHVISRMSSGESNMFFMLVDILANIKFNTLLLFDEPELHMHPNAVTLFMNIIYSLLDDYQSFAIIATHSPLIIREITGENVYVMVRNENIPVMRKIRMESFAANLTDLYDEIFSNKNTKHYFESVIAKLKHENMTYESVLESLRSEALEPNLNMRLMILNMFTE